MSRRPRSRKKNHQADEKGKKIKDNTSLGGAFEEPDDVQGKKEQGKKGPGVLSAPQRPPVKEKGRRPEAEINQCDAERKLQQTVDREDHQEGAGRGPEAKPHEKSQLHGRLRSG
jgi:hypothetical protein